MNISNWPSENEQGQPLTAGEEEVTRRESLAGVDVGR